MVECFRAGSARVDLVSFGGRVVTSVAAGGDGEGARYPAVMWALMLVES